MKWFRVRFKANPNDWRPVKWPPVGPCWCSGYSGDSSVVIAYVRTIDQITEYWPEAEDLDAEEKDEITFTDRFQKPEWWNEEKGEPQ